MSNNSAQKGLNPFDFFAIGFGAIVGVGWALSLNRWMANSGGPVPAAIGYLMVIVLLVPVALCYCELTPMLPVAGGGAAFAYRAFGEVASIISGWACFGAFAFMLPWEAIYVTDILTMLIPGIKSGDPLYSLYGGDIYLGGIIIGIVVAGIITFMNIKGAASAAGFQKLMVVILLAAAVIGIVAGLFKFDMSNLQPLYENVNDANHKSMFGGILAIMTSAPFFMCGFETIPQAVEDADGDVKDVGKAVVMAVTLAALFYALALFVLGGAMPWQEFVGVDTPAVSNLFLSAYGGTVGYALYVIILVGTLAGLLTTWNGFFVAAPPAAHVSGPGQPGAQGPGQAEPQDGGAHQRRHPLLCAVHGGSLPGHRPDRPPDLLLGHGLSDLLGSDLLLSDPAAEDRAQPAPALPHPGRHAHGLVRRSGHADHLGALLHPHLPLLHGQPGPGPLSDLDGHRPAALPGQRRGAACGAQGTACCQHVLHHGKLTPKFHP